jgi:hypothetical protein
MKVKSIVLAMAMVTFVETACWADTDPVNEPPPAGAILDLNGLPLPGDGNGTTYQLFSVDFTAALTSTAITFAFRSDPYYISFNGASVVNLTTSSSNLLLNGNFLGGVYSDNGNSSTPVDWTYANVYGARAGGTVTGCTPDPWVTPRAGTMVRFRRTMPSARR